MYSHQKRYYLLALLIFCIFSPLIQSYAAPGDAASVGLEGTTDVERRRADFWKFFKEYDARHGKNIQDIFPEMTDFFKLCEAEANKW